MRSNGAMLCQLEWLGSRSDDLAPKNSWNVYVGEHKRASMMPVGAIALLFFDVPLPKGTVSKPDYREELAASSRVGLFLFKH